MRKFIALIGSLALAGGMTAALAEEKTPAQMSDAIYDIQHGIDSPEQIQALRVKGAATIGGALTVTGTVAPAGGMSAASLIAGTAASAINGFAVTNLNAANLKVGTSLPAVSGSAVTNLNASNLASGNVPLAALTNAVFAQFRTGTCTNFATISFSPALSSTPFVTASWRGDPGTNAVLFVRSVSQNSFVLGSTVPTTNTIFWVAVNVL